MDAELQLIGLRMRTALSKLVIQFGCEPKEEKEKKSE